MSLCVGYIGLGRMGAPMARNILNAGFPLVVYNRTSSKCEELAAEGAAVATTPAQLASQADVIFTNLPDSPEVLEVLFGPSGVSSGIRKGSVFVDNSTIKPDASKEIYEKLQAKGVEAFDAPVSGGEVGAMNGTLTMMVGGNKEALQRVLPVLQCVAKSVTWIGPPGAGQVCKAANQIMVAAQMVAMGELLVFTQKCGVDPQSVINVIKGGAAQCWALDQKPQKLLAGDRQAGFRCSLQHKDLKIVSETGAAYGAPLPATSVNLQLFSAMVQQGHGDDDHSAVVSVLEQMGNTEIGAQPPISK